MIGGGGLNNNNNNLVGNVLAKHRDHAGHHLGQITDYSPEWAWSDVSLIFFPFSSISGGKEEEKRIFSNMATKGQILSRSLPGISRLRSIFLISI